MYVNGTVTNTKKVQMAEDEINSGYNAVIQGSSLVLLNVHPNSEKAVVNAMQTCNSVTFYFMKNSFSDVSRKWILPNMIRAVFHEI